MGKLFVEGQPESERFQIGTIIGSEYLPLDDRAVDFDLIEPTGVDRLWTKMLRESTCCKRCIAAAPRCDEPLSTIQNSRVPERTVPLPVLG
jgi:hypothetical protein